MNRHAIIFFPILFVFLGCSIPSKPLESQSNQPGFYGQVVDQNSQPISGVSIQCFYYSTSDHNQLYVDAGQIGIMAHARDSTAVTLYIYPLGKNLPIDTIRDSGGGGLRLLKVNTALYRNGFYNLTLQSADSTWTIKCLFQNLVNAGGYDSTNAEGKFFLDYDLIGVTNKFSPPFIVDSIQFVLSKARFWSITQGFILDSSKPIIRSFIMSSI